MRDKSNPNPPGWLLTLLAALIVFVSTLLPGYLLLSGLPWPWALALLAGFVVVSVSSFILGRIMK